MFNVMELTGNEIYHIQFVLPVVSDLKTLQTAMQILNKLNIKETDQNDENIREVDFSEDDIGFLKGCIQFLDSIKKLNIEGLSLYNKILEYKGVK